MIRLVQQISKKQENTYRYVFDYISEGGPRHLKAFHASDLAYTFHVNGGLAPSFFTEKEEKLSADIIDYWVNFAKTGNPSPHSSAVANWPKYSLSSKNIQRLSIPIETLGTFREEKLGLWDKLYPQYVKFFLLINNVN